MDTHVGPCCPWPPSQHLNVVIKQLQSAGGNRQSVFYRLTCDRRASERWPVAWLMEGWLQMDESRGEPADVALADFSSGGVGIVLDARHPLHSGQQGVLTSQSHGAGCTSRAVRGCWQRLHPVDQRLQAAGLCFV